MLLESGILSPDAPWWVLLFAFAIGHFLGDYPLQGDFIAIRKNHRLAAEDAGLPGMPMPRGVWFHCLTAHSAIHGGLVWLITGIPFLALVEFVLHWLIDFAKSEGWTNFHVDQGLHFLCKAVYIILLVNGLLPEAVLLWGK